MGPTRRDVEQAIREHRERDRPGDADGPGDGKLLVGVSLDAFSLPPEARGHVERSAALASSAPVVVADDDESAEDAAHVLGLLGAGRGAGFEREAFLGDVQAGEQNPPEGD
jgi:hypothetical protein